MRGIKLAENKWHTVIFLIIITLFVVTRSIYLNRDLPPNGISSYVSVDEMYYTIPAFNFYHYGETTHNTVPLLENYSSKDMQPTNILENILTYFSLSIFGNNYYGLRFASTGAALVSFVLIYLILRRKLNDDFDQRNYVLYVAIFYLLCDFAFLMAGRVAEPTIFRMTAMLIVVYIGSLSYFSRTLKSKRQSMLLGFISMAAVLFVYLYNVFIFVAMFFTIIAWSKKGGMRNIVIQTASFILGSMVCILSYQWFIDIVYQSSLAEVYRFVSPYQVRMDSVSGLVDHIILFITNIFSILMTNIFRFNIMFLFMLLASLPIFLNRVKNAQTNFEIMIFNLFFFLVMQSIVINDYPLRKLIMILPLAVIIIAMSCKNCVSFYTKERHNERKNRQIKLYLFTSYLISLAIWIVYFFSIKTTQHFAEVEISMYVNLIVFIVVSFYVILSFRHAKLLTKYGIIICIVILLLPNVYLDNKYVFSNRSFYYRDAMIGMADKIDGEFTIGGCAYGFRLYNSSIPVLDSYTGQGPGKREDYNQLFDSLFEQEIGNYSIAYTNDDNIDSPMGAAYMEEHGLALIEEYELGDAVNTNVGLYSLRR